MKTLKCIALIIIMGVISNFARAQKTAQVPEKIIANFSARYPQAHLKNWKVENNQYLASFTLDKRECMSTFNNEGTWLNTETTFRNPYRHLSPEIRYSLRNSSYAAYHVDQVQDLRLPSRDIYLLRVDNNSGNTDAYENAGSVDRATLYFSRSGQFIRASQW